MIGIFSWFRGKDLDKDPEFQALIANPENRKRVYGESATLLDKKLTRSQWTAMWIFVGAIAVVAFLGAFPELRPLVGGKPLSMVLTIQMFMLLAGALMIIFTKTDPSQIGKNEVFRAGMIAVVAVFGVAWMADTVFEANLPESRLILSDLVKTQPWTFAIALLSSPSWSTRRRRRSAPWCRWACRSACRPATSWPLPPRATATTSCRPTPATWPRSSSTARAPHASASTSSTTASSCRG
jgi:anaerobic C4-dicarboxylate transporter